MGSCISCCSNQSEDVYEEHNDKTNLLRNPVGEPIRSGSQSIGNKHGTEGIGDHQEKLNRILQKTANSYIDVPALNTPVDQLTEKTKDYESKVQNVVVKKEQSEKLSLLEETNQLEGLLSEEPLPEGDLKMVRDMNSSILNALQSIEITNSESLVIPFNPPKESS